MNWRPLIALSTAQFLMVLDQAVMNVSISQLVEDFDTTVTVGAGNGPSPLASSSTGPGRR